MEQTFAKRMLAFLLLGTLSCAEQEPLDFCSDPIGADTYSAENGGWICFLPDINGCFIFQSSSTPSITSIAVTGHTRGTIATTGQASCLGEVLEKPSSGYASSVEAKAGHGYVVKFPDNTYARFYIVSVEKNASGTITRINMTRQYSF
jgi:hypothetical protein